MELAGEKARRITDKYVKQVRCRSVQADETWTFVHTKERRLKPTDPYEYGDQYVFIALEADTRLVVAYTVGKKNPVGTRQFLQELKSRLSGRTQLTTDAWGVYPPLVEEVLGGDVDYPKRKAL